MKSLNSGHYLELLDRLGILMSTLDQHCIDHPVAIDNKKINNLLEKAMKNLWEAYQEVGAISPGEEWKEK